MPRYTDISLSAAARIAAQYGLTARSLTHLSEGVENSNYRVECVEGVYVFTVLENRDLGSARAYADYLADLILARLPLPTLVPRIAGDYVSDRLGKPVVVTEFAPGERPDKCPDTEMVRLGTVLARIHATACPKATPEPVVRFGEREHRLIESFEDRAFAKWLIRCLEKSRRVLTAPAEVGLTHGDIFPDNLVVSDSGSVTVLDWENSAEDILVLDLGMALVGTATVNSEYSPDRAHHLLAGYRANPLREVEGWNIRDAVVYAAAFTAFHRYLKHEITDRSSGRQGSYKEIVHWLDSFQRSSRDLVPNKPLRQL